MIPIQLEDGYKNKLIKKIENISGGKKHILDFFPNRKTNRRNTAVNYRPVVALYYDIEDGDYKYKYHKLIYDIWFMNEDSDIRIALLNLLRPKKKDFEKIEKEYSKEIKGKFILSSLHIHKEKIKKIKEEVLKNQCNV